MLTDRQFVGIDALSGRAIVAEHTLRPFMTKFLGNAA